MNTTSVGRGTTGSDGPEAANRDLLGSEVREAEDEEAPDVHPDYLANKSQPMGQQLE